MGRVVRRVPLDFQWPLQKTWKGFINPHYKSCAWCRGRGNTKAAQRFDTFGRRLDMAAEASSERPADFVPLRGLNCEDNKMSVGHNGEQVWHRSAVNGDELPRWPFPGHDPVEVLMTLSGLPDEWLTPVEEHAIRMMARVDLPETFYLPRLTAGRYYPHPYLCWEDGIPDVGPKFHELLQAIDPEYKVHFGGGGSWKIQKAIMKHVGVPFTVEDRSFGDWEVFDWGNCEQCNGEGIDPAAAEAYEAWEDYDPPEGEAYQIWETTSEGSPITPPKGTPEELAQWCVDNRASTFGSQTCSYESWLSFIRGPGWAPTMVISNGQISSGVEEFGDSND